jgi:hypothetical protein
MYENISKQIATAVAGMDTFQKYSGPFSRRTGQRPVVKFMPKYPVINVNGRKMRDVMVN